MQSISHHFVCLVEDLGCDCWGAWSGRVTGIRLHHQGVGRGPGVSQVSSCGSGGSGGGGYTVLYSPSILCGILTAFFTAGSVTIACHPACRGLVITALPCTRASFLCTSNDWLSCWFTEVEL